MPEKTNRSKGVSWLHGLGTVAALGMLVFLFSQQGWDEIMRALGAIPLWRLATALGLTLVSRLAVAGRWYALLATAGTGVTPWKSVQITFAGLFASQFLPTTVGGDVIRLAGGLRSGMNRAVCIASLIVDRLVGMAGMGMAALLLVFQLPELWRQLQIGSNIHPGLTSATTLVVAASESNWAGRGLAWFRKAIVRMLQALSIWLRHPGGLLLALCFTWIHMLCVFGSIALFLPPLGEAMPFWKIAGLWSFTYFVTLLPVSLNGLGVQELSITFFFSEFGGIAMSNALTLALLLRVLPMFASLPGALSIPGLLAGTRQADQDLSLGGVEENSNTPPGDVSHSIPYSLEDEKAASDTNLLPRGKTKG
jgi:glycosyltransferase 2 family protein